MVDAMSVTPYAKIKYDGTMNGLIGISQIFKKKIRKKYDWNEDKWMNFIKVNYDLIIQAEFGITYVCGSIPIRCISSKSGKARLDIIEKVEELIVNLNAKVDMLRMVTS